jgi:hypothetical protein
MYLFLKLAYNFSKKIKANPISLKLKTTNMIKITIKNITFWKMMRINKFLMMMI